ncbi:MAG TPA: class I SAM-dependent methyltransferase, partial [Bacteroidia bacterium]|nr:class I SAM-dependent methyltransferase [Bacteroidia bacterium]
CIDYGGGYGLFVRMMRDKGFQFYRYDTYCQNLFALHFDFKDSTVKKFDILTAFEVFEHLANPLEEIEKMLEMSDNLIFSTIIAPVSSNEFDKWWYRAPLSGQHVSFYTIDSLKLIAKKYGKHFYSNNQNFHIISGKEIDDKALNDIFFPPKSSLISRIVNKLSRKQSYSYRKSLQETDYKFIEQEALKQIK